MMHQEVINILNNSILVNWVMLFLKHKCYFITVELLKISINFLSVVITFYSFGYQKS